MYTKKMFFSLVGTLSPSIPFCLREQASFEHHFFINFFLSFCCCCEFSPVWCWILLCARLLIWRALCARFMYFGIFYSVQ